MATAVDGRSKNHKLGGGERENDSRERHKEREKASMLTGVE